MASGKERRDNPLESQAVAAHRAYVNALAEWERAYHLASCPICLPEGVSDAEHTRRCESAETEKERRRVAFRDLCDELGYVPSGHSITLPTEGKSCPRQHDDADGTPN